MVEENVTLQGVLHEIEGLLVKLLAASNANEDVLNGKTGFSVEPNESYRLETSSSQWKDETEDTCNENKIPSKESNVKKQLSAPSPPAPPCPNIHVPLPSPPNTEEATSSGHMPVIDHKPSTQSSIGHGNEMQRQVSFMPVSVDQKFLDSEEDSSEVIQMHHAWQVLGDRPSSSMRRRGSHPLFNGVAPEITSQAFTVEVKEESWSRRIWLPNMRVIWACLTGMVIAFDSATIPLMAFGTYHIWTGTVIFWICNLPIRLFLLKYLGQGEPWGRCFAALELPLLSVMLYQWLNAGALPLCQGVYMLRILQMPRLYRITGFPRLVRRWFHQSSREVRAVANIFAAMILCLFCLHVLTCLWFAVGSMDGADTAETLKDLSMLDQYRKSAELALSRLHPSQTYENMQFNTLRERLLAVLATGLALLGGSIFTSIVTNDLSDIRRVRRMQKEAEYQVSDFFMIYPVSWALELQVKDHLKQNMARTAPPCKQEMNDMLPDFLYRELCREALTPVLHKHEVLYDLCSHHLAFQYDLCVQCLVDWNVGAHEILFSHGLKSEQMLILTSGTIAYYKETVVDAQSVTTQKSITSLVRSLRSDAGGQGQQKRKGTADATLSNVGDWMCEASLWCPWYHMGRAVSETRAALLCLNYLKLLAAATRHKEAGRELVIYARHFTERLRNTPEVTLRRKGCWRKRIPLAHSSN